MSGPELIDWLKNECEFRKLPPTDSAMILVLRGMFDIDTCVKTLRHLRAEQRAAQREGASK